MNTPTTLTRLAGGTLIALAGTAALAIPAQAMTAPGPEPVGTGTSSQVSVTPTPVPRAAADGSTDWHDVGLGLAGGVVLAGAAYSAGMALRRSRRPSLA
jgi:hypothetical protein